MLKINFTINNRILESYLIIALLTYAFAVNANNADSIKAQNMFEQARLDSAHNSYEEELMHIKIADSMETSFLSAKTKKRTLEIENQYQLAKYQGEVLEKKQELDKAKYEAQTRYVRWLFYLLGIILVVTIGYFAFTSMMLKRKNRWQKAQQHLELSKLKSAIQPAFINDSFQHIQNLLGHQDKAAANQYISNLSKLMQHKFEYSETQVLSLDKVIESVELFLQLKSEQFAFPLEFEINTLHLTNLDFVDIPGNIVLQVLEDRFNRSFRKKEIPFYISINFKINENETLICSIEDNGNMGAISKSNDGSDLSHSAELTSFLNNIHQEKSISITEQITNSITYVEIKMNINNYISL